MRFKSLAAEQMGFWVEKDDVIYIYISSGWRGRYIYIYTRKFEDQKGGWRRERIKDLRRTKM